MDLGQSLAQGTQSGIQLGQYFAGLQQQQKDQHRQDNLLQRQKEQDILKSFESFGDALDKRERREQLKVELGRKEEEYQYQLGNRNTLDSLGLGEVGNAVRKRNIQDVELGRDTTQFNNQQTLFGNKVERDAFDLEQAQRAVSTGTDQVGREQFNQNRITQNDFIDNQLATQKFQVSQEKLTRDTALKGIKNDILGGGTAKLSNFGYESDSTPDSNSRNSIGHNDNTLVDGRSAAITKSMANRMGLEKGAVLKVATDKGSFLVTYDNTVPSRMPSRFKGAGKQLPETIDLFRPEDGSNDFGGKVYGVEMVRQGKSGLLGKSQDDFTANNFAEASRSFATQGQEQEAGGEDSSDLEARLAFIDAEIKAVNEGLRPSAADSYKKDLIAEREPLARKVAGISNSPLPPVPEAPLPDELETNNPFAKFR